MPLALVRAMDALAPTRCPHCDTESTGGRYAPFCCGGCREVHELLRAEGLSHYYDLAPSDGVPARPVEVARSHVWLEPLLTAAERSAGPVCSLELDVQGIHCAACVWLLNELFRRRVGSAGITVNPTLGKARLSWQRGRFDIAAYVSEVERFGYQLGPSRKHASPTSRELPMRIGVCAAIAMNVMMFSVAFYGGLAPSDGELFRVFSGLSLWLSALAVVVGGWPFFRAALQGVRRGLLHLDLPIAVGIVLAFATSVLEARSGHSELVYFDTLDVFITLMLTGRWVQQRVLERNRRFLLDDGGADGIHVRRREEGSLVVRRADEIRSGDELVIAPGDLVPVDAELRSGTGEVSTDWINGEPTPQTIARGAAILGGSFNAGRTALEVKARTAFSESPLPALLRAGVGNGAQPVHARLTETISRYWVPSVLALAAFGLSLWWRHGPAAALDVTAALLIVTCPCALGIALPLATELALTQLRRRGVFVRSGDLLDRVLRLRRVVFDKTGTLTLARLELNDTRPLDRMPPTELLVLHDMTARSNHPVSRCIAAELARRGVASSADVPVMECPGQGLELIRDGHVYRLGRAQWAAAEAASDDSTPFTRDGQVLARVGIRESMRADAAHEIAELQRDGREVWLASGDTEDRVSRAADALGIPIRQALACQSPEAKAAAVYALGGESVLFVGDGLNDSLAFAAAGATGTPAVDRPVMPGKADFFLMGDGIGGVRHLFSTARALRVTLRRILVVSLAYNALVVGLALAGAMTPLRAAVAMPLSSIAVLLLAVRGLSTQATRESNATHAPSIAPGAESASSTPEPRTNRPSRAGAVFAKQARVAS